SRGIKHKFSSILFLIRLPCSDAKPERGRINSERPYRSRPVTGRDCQPNSPGSGSSGEPMPAVSAAPQDSDILAFFANAPHMALETGQVLFAEGDPPNSMYVVKSGTLRI